MKNLTVKQINELLQAKKISALELAQDYLAKIHALNSKINAFVTLDEEQTLLEAKQADERLRTGQGHFLTGIPIAYKDLFCHQNWRTACASRMLDNFISPYTATVVKNLEKAGMVTLGRTNMDEFAMGSTNESSYYGAVLNPWHKEHVAGGSSGGSAAAVSAGLVPVALGSDTGGSIRQPASHCGITGIKPTYGVVSRFGMVAYASSFDQAGPMAQTAEDCALLLNVMASFDEKDSTSYDKKFEDYTHGLGESLKGLKIGLPQEYLNSRLDADVEKTIQQSVALLTSLGAKVIDISLPNTELSIPAYYVLASAEASTNLSRYDGVRYGYRANDYDGLDEMYTKTRTEGFGTEVKRRIMIGTYVLSHGYYDAYYVKAMKLRRMLVNDFQNAFKQCDVILAPVTPNAAPKLGEVVNDPVKMYLSDIFTLSLNLCGLPGMSLPAGFSQNGLPIGVQLIGNYFTEAKILNVAHQMQQNSDFHLQHPHVD